MKQNGYFQVVVTNKDGSWVNTRKYKTMNKAYNFKNYLTAHGYNVSCKWVRLENV